MAQGPPTILESRDRYMDALALRGRSPGSLRTYGQHLGAFFAFLRTQGVDPAQATPSALSVDHLELYLAERTRAGAAPATRQLALQAISGFYRYLCLRELLAINTESLRARLAALTVKVPKRRPEPPDTLERTTAPALVHRLGEERATQNVQGDLLSLRNVAILQTLYGTGMRVSELVSLNRTHLQAGGYAVITGKGGKQRTVYFSPDALSAIAAYLAARTDDLAPLFIQHHNPVRTAMTRRERDAGGSRQARAARKGGEEYRLSARMVERIVRAVAHAAGVEATPHTYRHHFATTVLHSGELDVRDVQELLGHSSLATTQIYLHPREERLARGLRRIFAPREGGTAEDAERG